MNKQVKLGIIIIIISIISILSSLFLTSYGFYEVYKNLDFSIYMVIGPILLLLSMVLFCVGYIKIKVNKEEKWNDIKHFTFLLFI